MAAKKTENTQGQQDKKVKRGLPQLGRVVPEQGTSGPSGILELNATTSSLPLERTRTNKPVLFFLLLLLLSTNEPLTRSLHFPSRHFERGGRHASQTTGSASSSFHKSIPCCLCLILPPFILIF
mmetsp:Transcript_13876/g.45270  ORF Transcript_13876/g.45270 Transcript_13876/m.45270 type:complete len:124 (-) Transcript_13876:718-1089(-)